MIDKPDTDISANASKSETDSKIKSPKPSYYKDGPSERPSDRMFRRSRRAEMRRRKAAKEDASFFRVIYSLAGVATAFVFVLIYMASSGGGVGLASQTPLAEPWIGPISKLEIFGFGTIGVLTVIYLMRLRKK